MNTKEVITLHPNAILLHPDKFTFQGPQIDGGYKVTLYIGEYEVGELQKLMALSNQQIEVKIS